MAAQKRSLLRELTSGVESMRDDRGGRIALERHVVNSGGRARRSAPAGEPITRGTGNVFADLGFPDAESRHAKLRLAHALNQSISDRKLSNRAGAKALGVDAAELVALRSYRLAGFTIERLIDLLAALDREVEIVIRERAHA